IDAPEAFGRDIRAHQQEIAAQLLHQVELALGAREHALALVGRHALEIAERLEGDDLEPDVTDQLAHVGGGAAEGEQVVLEDLDALEAGAGDGVELLGEVAAQGDRGNRHLHGLPPAFPSACPQATAAGVAASRSASADANVRCMRATSACSPVNRRNVSAAWCTHIPPPVSVRAPAARAALISSVSIGV